MFFPLSSRPAGSEHQILHPWVTINLVVALLVGLAWIFIASKPETDYTEGQTQDRVLNTVFYFHLLHLLSCRSGYLMTMEIEPPKPEDKSEMTA